MNYQDIPHPLILHCAVLLLPAVLSCAPEPAALPLLPAVAHQTDYWYLAVAGEITGPHTRTELAALAISPDSMVARAGASEWCPAVTDPGLSPLFAGPARQLAGIVPEEEFKDAVAWQRAAAVKELLGEPAFIEGRDGTEVWWYTSVTVRTAAGALQRPVFYFGADGSLQQLNYQTPAFVAAALARRRHQ